MAGAMVQFVQDLGEEREFTKEGFTCYKEW
jgi:hypothetical protein